MRDAKIFPNIGMRRTSLTSELIGVGCLEIVIAGIGPSIVYGDMAWPWHGHGEVMRQQTPRDLCPGKGDMYPSAKWCFA